MYGNDVLFISAGLVWFECKINELMDQKAGKKDVHCE